MGRKVAAIMVPLLALLATPAAGQQVFFTPDMMHVVTNPLSQMEGCCGAHLGDGICTDGSAAIGATRCCGSDNGHCNFMCCDCTAGCKTPVDETVPPEAEGIAEDLQELRLNEYPMISTHDAGTGYEQKYFCNALNPVGNYAVCQRGSFAEQLNCGARVFDLRPWKTEEGKLIMHHGDVVFDMEVSDAMDEIEEWLSTRPTELVILYIKNCAGPTSPLFDACPAAISAVIEEKDYFILTPSKMKTMTVKKAMTNGKHSRRPGGGAIAVVYTLGANWYDKSIACYTINGENCVSTNAHERKGRYEALSNYLDLHLNDPEVPFANGTFWNTQAHWQYDAYNIAIGLASMSCLLAEESASDINKLVANSISQDHFNAINLLEVDYVCHGGKELYMSMQAFARRYLEKKNAAASEDSEAASGVVEEYAASGQPAGPRTFRPCYGRALLILAPYAACVGVLAAVALRAFRGLRPRRPAGELGAAAAVPLADTHSECVGAE